MRILLLLVVSLFSLILAVGVFSVHNAHVHSGAAEEFLALVGENRAREAFDSTTTGFREGFTWERFNEFVNRFHLGDYRAGSLRTTRAFTEYRSLSGLTIALAGDAALRDGTPFHLDVTLAEENRRWKVEHVYVNFRRRPGMTGSSAPTPFPAGTDAAFESKPLRLQSDPRHGSPDPLKSQPDPPNVDPLPNPTILPASPPPSPP